MVLQRYKQVSEIPDHYVPAIFNNGVDSSHQIDRRDLPNLVIKLYSFNGERLIVKDANHPEYLSGVFQFNYEDTYDLLDPDNPEENLPVISLSLLDLQEVFVSIRKKERRVVCFNTRMASI